MSGFKIITSGFMTTIQDNGRFNFQKYGIPVAGAMDRRSLELANILVGNSRDAAGLEITYTGPAIEFESSMAIAITGADMSPTINGKQVEAYKTIYVNSGDVLSFGGLKNGLRTYLAIEGGIDVPSIMGSKSTYLKAELGGFEGRKLKAGDRIQTSCVSRTSPIGTRKIPSFLIPRYDNEICVRVIMGPEDDCFTSEGLSAFLENQFTVTDQSDRMGLRLQGPVITHKNHPDILSSGINLGTIQVAGNEQPIILMADRQTTGGYTRIANVISIDIPRLAQARPGDRVRFQSVDVELAQRLLREVETETLRLVENFEMGNYDIPQNGQEYLITLNGKRYEVSVAEIE